MKAKETLKKMGLESPGTAEATQAILWPLVTKYTGTSAVHLTNDGEKAKCGARSYYRSGMLYITDDRDRVTCKRCLGTVEKTSAIAELTGDYVGKIFTYSFGYDMTINVFAKVVRQTKKTLFLQEVEMSVSDDCGQGSGRAEASPEITENGVEYPIIEGSKIIKAQKRVYPYGEYWVSGRHHWYEWDGKPKYHNTWD